MMIYTAAVLTLGFTVHTLFFVLLAGLAFFRPFLRETGVLRDLDEREIASSHRSSHMAFFLVLAAIITYIIYRSVFLREEVPTEWFLILMIAILGKILTGAFLSPEKRKIGLYIGFFFGLAWLLFTILSHGFSFDTLTESSVVGGPIIGATLIAWRFPRTGGTLLVAEGLFASFFFLKPNSPLMTILMFLTLAFPILLAGILQFAPEASEEAL
jgi:hypothetical protein